MTNDGNNTLVYDAENRVLSATNGSASGTYTYDGDNLRVKKVSGSTTTVYIFSGSKVIAEYVGGVLPASPTREYIYSGSALLAKIDSSGTNYYQQDHLSNRMVTDSSGNSVAQLGHYPFGESWYNASNDKLLFTSYERDSESANDYAMMRSYVNRLARFSSPDLLSGSINNPQSLNHYSYGLNDPANLIDPTGLFISNAPPDPIWGPPGGPDFGGGAGGGGLGCLGSGDDFLDSNTYLPTSIPSGCLYLGPLQRGGGHGGGGGQKIKDIINNALKQAKLSECLNQLIGPGTVLTNENLPYLNGTLSGAQISALRGVPNATGTVDLPVPATGRGTAIVASENLGNLDQATRTYLHETANILAIQQFNNSGINGWQRALLGPLGGPPTAQQVWAQAHPGNDPDIGRLFELCVFGADTTIVVH